jgi:hypothetical protein
MALGKRPQGSHAKIRVVRDSIVILNTMLALFRDYKPLTFFGSLGVILIVCGLFLGLTVIIEFLQTGLVPRLPSAIMAVALVLAGMLSGTVGFIVHTIVRRFQEIDQQLRLVVDELKYMQANGKADITPLCPIRFHLLNLKSPAERVVMK